MQRLCSIGENIMNVMVDYIYRYLYRHITHLSMEFMWQVIQPATRLYTD